MEKTKIRKCIFIGLGGTGMTSLLYTKKMFYDTYGEIPPMVAFLGLDTDGGWYNKSLDAKDGTKVELLPSEQLPIYVKQDPQLIYKKQKSHLKWFPEKDNLKYLKSMTLGAGQLRSNGRFAFTCNETEVYSRIKQVSDKVSSIHNVTNPKYALLAATTEVHLVFSVSGGTGCGTFLNTAYLIKEVCPDCKLCAYAVLPDIFETEFGMGANMEKVKPNAYGALVDLDYLMHLDATQNPITIEYFTKEIQKQSSPFNAVYLIDNKNENDDVYDKTDNLAEMISLALVSATGELSVATASVSDNVEKIIQNGNMNIRNKLAWAAGFGISEIVYDSKALVSTFVDKTVERIVERLLAVNGDPNVDANSWIDTVHIRENRGKDDVTDFILNPTLASFVISNPNEAEEEAKAYEVSFAVKPEVLSQKVDSLLETAGTSLVSMIDKRLNAEAGVGSSLAIISAIEEQVNLCLGEMRDEISKKQDTRPMIDSEVDGAIKELSGYMSKSFFLRTRAQERIRTDAVQDAVTKRVRNEREIARREAAITFYTAFLQKLAAKKTEIDDIKALLVSVKTKVASSINKRQNLVGSNVQLFSIDLAQEEIRSISYNDEQIVFPSLLNTLKPASISSFRLMTDVEIEKALRNYAVTLPDVETYGKKSVEEALRNILKADPDKFDEIINNAVVKSKPLFKVNFIGEVPPVLPEDYMYVGVPDKANSVLIEEDRLKTRLEGFNRVDFSSLGSTDRIIIYHQIGNVPVFAVEPVPGYQQKYSKQAAFCHWDLMLKRRMDSENFSIMPAESEDLSLEYWVKGFIFGLIKKEAKDSMYYFQSVKLGDPLDNYWVCLGSAYRDVAYEAFRANQDVVCKEYEDIFQSKIQKEGRDKIEAEVEEAKKNYLEVSQIGIDRKTLNKKGYEGTADLFRQELNYIKNMTI